MNNIICWLDDWADVSGNQAESGAASLTAGILERSLFNTVSERQ